ncbi:chromatin remodeling complex subunit, partial [Genlisea aurea]
IDCIDISSTDSDPDLREIDNYTDKSPVRDAASSGGSRVLPPWPVSSNNDLADVSSSKRKIVNDGMSPTTSKRQNIGKTIGTTSSMTNGSNVKVGSHDRMKLAMNPNRHYSSQTRALPLSFQPSTSNVQFHNVVENTSAAGANGNHGMSFPISGAETDPLLYDRRVNRLLPPSLMRSKNSLANALSGLNDSLLHTVVADESQGGSDERLVLQAAVQNLHAPKAEVDVPQGLMSVSLLRHQKIALAWMLSKESSGLCLGGILADDQGLGKTVSMIALIQMQKIFEEKSKSKESCNIAAEALNLDDDDDAGNNDCVVLDSVDQPKQCDDFKVLPQASNAVNRFQSRRPTAGTLIVCPASVLRQWHQELRDKIPRLARLRVLIYHGGNRPKNPVTLAQYDAVLTTYAIVSNEVPKQPMVEEDDDEQKDGDGYGLSSAFSEKKGKKSIANKKAKKGSKEIDIADFDSSCGTLARVKWSRVILDESQMIKNHRTQVARACCSLRAKRRWCLSGTPIQNSIDELFSYFRFLRYAPYDKYKTFTLTIKNMISRDSIKGYQKLQAVLKNIMLRRTKGKV